MGAVQSRSDAPTPAQQRAVVARGNVLVMAGAGTGKTKTLVERCLHCLEHDGASVDELLIVTFTEAAAAEMRDRLRKAIERKARDEAGGDHESAVNHSEGRWSEQLARFDLAHIGTLHSFCLKLVREHFYELGLDPQVSLLEEGESLQLANEVLDELFDTYYAGDAGFPLAVQNLIQVHGGGRDESIRKLVLQLHHYSQARPDAGGWLARQRQSFAPAVSGDWERWLWKGVTDWFRESAVILESQKGENEKAAELLPILSQLAGLSFSPGWRELAAGTLAQVISADGSWPNRRKLALRKPLESIFDEAEFLHSLAAARDGTDPLAEDWSWIRVQMETLLRIAEEFAAKLDDRKLTNGLLDFHDLEQHALRLLWNLDTGQPAAIATGWRALLKFIFVDEYQDINAAQDRIIQGLSRTDAQANRFLVGDVKQSIYRFRLADPKIFRDYAQNWRGAAGEAISLSDNFRTRANLLDFVNSVFRRVMQAEVGGVAYDAEAELKFGSGQQRAVPGPGEMSGPGAELLLRFKNGRGEARDEEGGESSGVDDAQYEARLVAWRLRQLVDQQHRIFDSELKAYRPVKWRDAAILLRSPRGRSEVYAKEFERAGIPLAVARGGFYQSAEILDLLSLLQLLDNPLQDIPCVAVLRSPLAGLSLDELAEIRLVARDRHFWTALNRSAEGGLSNPESTAKVTRFLARFSRWRKLARLVSLSQCLEAVLTETLYADWLQAQPRGVQRAANVDGFLHLARQFDQFQRQGLYRFLKFIEAQQEAGVEPEAPAVTAGDAVRLMSIHQSKGLEFPVVVLGDLGRQFNERDLRGEIIFDEEFGLCPKVKPPQSGRRYPSLPYWLAQRRQRAELRGEELRLLYVAFTRARDHLILAAGITEKSWDEKWIQPQAITMRRIAAAKSFADWVALWFSNQDGVRNDTAGGTELLRWQVVPDTDLGGAAADPVPVTFEKPDSAAADATPDLEQLRARLEWSYSSAPATRRKAKSSVTALRREAEETDDESERLFLSPESRGPRRRQPRPGVKLSAADIGNAHHKFLEHFELTRAADLAGESERLVRDNYLSSTEQAALDLKALANFWESPLGLKIRTHADDVRRELPFTARFSPLELERVIGVKPEAGLAEEFVIVQGVADLVVLRPGEIWLVDFKTDDISAREMGGKLKLYKPQVQLYALALEKIFARKVTLRALHFLALGRTEEI